MFDGREKGVCGCATKNGNEGRVRAAALMRKDDEEIPLGPFVIDRRVPIEGRGSRSRSRSSRIWGGDSADKCVGCPEHHLCVVAK